MLRFPTIRRLVMMLIGLTFLNVGLTITFWKNTLPLIKRVSWLNALVVSETSRENMAKYSDEVTGNKKQAEGVTKWSILDAFSNSTSLNHPIPNYYTFNVKRIPSETKMPSLATKYFLRSNKNSELGNKIAYSGRLSNYPKYLFLTHRFLTRLQTTTKETRESHKNHMNIFSKSPTKSIIQCLSSLYVAKKSESIENLTTAEKPTAMPYCEKYPPDLGPIKTHTSYLKLEIVENLFPEVVWGGRYFPPNCIARHKVAIIVPYRDRRKHLAIFLNHMHPFLIKQQLEYGIYIVEQADRNLFNRGKLMNVGFVEAQRLKAGGWQCFVFHDIDLLPLDTRNMYSCPRQPRHMSASIDSLNFKLPYVEIFGGVSALTLEQFTKLNGFSNNYWGWGAEDDDMFYRLEQQNYHIARYKMSIARYAMLGHKESPKNPKRYDLLSLTNKTFQWDGLSTLSYKLLQVTEYHLYTKISVNLNWNAGSRLKTQILPVFFYYLTNIVKV